MATENKLGDLMINGFGTASGGEFDQVSINGKGTVNGDLQCHFFECNGSGAVNGDIKSEIVKISGNAKINGKVYTTDLKVEGRGVIKGNVLMSKMVISGTSFVDGNVKGEELKVQGKIVVDGDCEVEAFKAEGQFKVEGLLSAETIEIYTYGESRAKEIGGQTIKVKEKSNFLLNLLKTVKSVQLEADLIEGDHITLENTKAKVVRGNQIIIGQNCEIDLVEYKETFKTEKNGYVKESKQI